MVNRKGISNHASRGGLGTVVIEAFDTAISQVMVKKLRFPHRRLEFLEENSPDRVVKKTEKR